MLGEIFADRALGNLPAADDLISRSKASHVAKARYGARVFQAEHFRGLRRREAALVGVDCVVIRRHSSLK